jgi:prevent-host-death family protein
MPTATVNIYEAKTQLSKLVDQAASGDDVVIGRGGKPVARITRLTPAKRPIRFGVLKGKVRVAADFDAPLPADVQAAFAGGENQ